MYTDSIVCGRNSTKIKSKWERDREMQISEKNYFDVVRWDQVFNYI